MHHWIEAAKRGDREAFDPIVRQFTSMAFAVAYERLHDVQLAEDAVQEAFAEAFINLDKLKETEAFPGWFKVIVVHQANRILRRKRHPTVPLDDMTGLAESGKSISDIVEQKELRRLLHESVSSLSSNMRVAVQLFYFYGYSLQEISAYLGTSIPVLKKRLFDARRKLKGILPVADFAHVCNGLYEGGKHMLHIVNGDHVANTLRKVIPEGDILVWREVYPEGPNFTNPADASNQQVRAQYLEQALGIPAAEFTRLSGDQEQQLARFTVYEEVVLWFEHDLFDQTMLCYLLHWFAQQSLGHTKLSLLCVGSFPGIELFRGLGQLNEEQLASLSGTWQTVGREQLDLGSALWKAYTSPEPSKLVQLLREDTSALPYAKAAFQQHLAHFPSVHNGLGIVEQFTLEQIDCGITSPYELFKHVCNRLHELGMGDLQYWHVLAKLTSGTHPLLHVEGVGTFPNFQGTPPSFRECTLSLTEAGRQVLEGQADWVALNGIDTWLGGVHLTGQSVPWRWDTVTKALINDNQGS
ncbi:DNA-directed RNA polymerase subunit sigma [Paenibacillus sp. E194]|uniref:sigma-70 family RNA polymerase sigma factor n=1 Tax=Paenibacillus sp. E194 TaxID=1458845 RepID=UPI0005C85341|nr:sigma-70 family RNA polymerase sigma factor [Paenibacillus sp. E194]KJB85777.1 DNA-directed RNA polymerase subunit sigma [Paenibacillus sp. E194]